MTRNYATSPTMLVDRFTERVLQPDETLIRQLHRLLDTIPDDNHALMIDHIVYQLIQFHNPNRQHLEELLPPEAHL